MLPVQSLYEEMRESHVTAADAGSQSGPYYLGAGISFTDRGAVKRDLEIILPAALEKGIPVIIGSAGGSGGRPHLEWNIDIIKEIAEEKGLKFRMAVINAEIDKEYISKKLSEGKVQPLYPNQSD